MEIQPHDQNCIPTAERPIGLGVGLGELDTLFQRFIEVKTTQSRHHSFTMPDDGSLFIDKNYRPLLIMWAVQTEREDRNLFQSRRVLWGLVDRLSFRIDEE